MSRPGLGKTEELKRLHSVALPTPLQSTLTDSDDIKPEASGPAGDHKDVLAKVLVIGDIATGKTSIIGRYAHGVFSQRYKATIGVDFAWKPLKWENNTTVRLQLWDIAGQERFGHMTRVYYKEAVGAFVVYDVTRPNTFEAVIKWKEDINKKVNFPGSEEPIPTVLLCNKIDLLENGERSQTKGELDSFCEEHGFLGWFETSAKENIGIDDAANFLVKHILEKLATVPKEGEKESDEDDAFPLEARNPNTPPISLTDTRGKCGC